MDDGPICPKVTIPGLAPSMDDGPICPKVCQYLDGSFNG